MRVTFDQFSEALTDGLLRFARQEAWLDGQESRCPVSSNNTTNPLKDGPLTPPVSSKSSSASSSIDEDDIIVVANPPPLRILPSPRKAPPPSYYADVSNRSLYNARHTAVNPATAHTASGRTSSSHHLRFDEKVRSPREPIEQAEKRKRPEMEDETRNDGEKRRMQDGRRAATWSNNVPLGERRRVKVEARAPSPMLSVC